MQVNSINYVNNNQSFKALKIKNPKKMPTELLSALFKIRTEFDNFSNASVKLSKKSKPYINTHYYGYNSKTSELCRYYLAKLKFDLGDKTLEEFNIFNIYYKDIDSYSLPWSKRTKEKMNQVVLNMVEDITPENIRELIEKQCNKAKEYLEKGSF